MIAVVVLDALEAGHPPGLEHRAHHPQLLGAGERADPRPELDAPRRASVVGLELLDAVHEPHPRRIAVERGDLREQVVRRGVGDEQLDGRVHQRGRSVPRNARASSGLRAASTPSRSSPSSNVGSHGMATVASGSSSASGAPVTSATVGATPARIDGAAAVEAELRRRVGDPAGPARGARRRAGAAGSAAASAGRPGRGAEQPGRRVPAVVERPAQRDDHRVGVALAQRAGAHRVAAIGVARREPHQEAVDVEPVGHRRDIGAPGALAQPAHRRQR